MNKVLAIAPYPYLPYFSGGQKLIAQFFEYLGDEVDLTVVSVAENNFSLVKNYKTKKLLKGSFFRYVDVSLISKITEIIRKEGFDTIIWEHPYYAWLAFLIKKRTGIKTIIHTHNIEYQRFQSTSRWWWRALHIYERWSFNNVDYIFFITPQDKHFAINTWKINPEKCIDLAFGIDIENHPEDKEACKLIVLKTHAINSDEKIFLFTGLLSYKPNLDALKVILDKINPILLSASSFKYKIIICGKDLPVELNSLKQYADKNIIYAGFIKDVEIYYKAADIFLNPVQSGGGIKTKMVEAIAYGTTVIATATGAIGLNKEVCGNKLIIAGDNDWVTFTELILKKSTIDAITPSLFYEMYYWGNIIKKILSL